MNHAIQAAASTEEKIKIVAGAQPLHEPCSRKEREPQPLSLRVRVQPDQHERHPPGPHQLQLRQVCRAQRGEAEREPAQDGDLVPASDAMDQKVNSQRGEWIRKKEADVIGQFRRATEPLDRARQRHQAEQEFREAEDEGRRVERRGVPPCPGEGNLPGIAPQDPCIQQRIAEIVRQLRRECPHDRPRVHQAQRNVQPARQQPRAPSVRSAPVAFVRWHLVL